MKIIPIYRVLQIDDIKDEKKPNWPAFLACLYGISIKKLITEIK